MVVVLLRTFYELFWNVSELIEACNEHRPPPRQYRVSDAGCPFVNGIYNFAGAVTHDGYVKPGAEILYVRNILLDAIEGAGKKLTLDTISLYDAESAEMVVADDEQPGTERDIDYYQHKSKEHEKYHPPLYDWITCRRVGIDPPPTLTLIGRVVPD